MMQRSCSNSSSSLAINAAAINGIISNVIICRARVGEQMFPFAGKRSSPSYGLIFQPRPALSCSCSGHRCGGSAAAAAVATTVHVGLRKQRDNPSNAHWSVQRWQDN